MNYSCFLLLLVVCLVGYQGNAKESMNKESIDMASETLLKKEKPSSFRQHLDNLNLQLQQKNLRNLQLDSAGFKKHQEYFEDFYNRKDLSKPSSNNPKGNFDKALQKQLKQIEKLREDNNKIW
ncbi:hypothetical protein LS72_001345 [Helicobacter apodemus]|uniref:Uncharacterized protein n=1 Tax=Helicobacter apodemus TaxID=135569 RepID=A0A4U8UGA3_9HELI|nr:hypothetical protein [Helicobacter apodemus]TLE17056.1 hypothetical protein LS72_001345 [Helicobacter apodemus]